MFYHMTFAIITVALVSGAIVERTSFKACFWFILLWSTLVYVPLVHMVWGRGLLASIGVLDFAGGTVVHIGAGVSALVAAWILGPRKDWMVKPMIPHNVPYVLLGVGILWFGWFGLSGGHAMGAGALTTVAVVATTAAAAAGGLTWTIAEWLLKSKPTAIGMGSGFVTGLVGITPAAGFVTPLSAILIGAATALASYFAIHLKAKLQFDDSLDTFPIHGIGGTVGIILTGVFATRAVNPAGSDGLLFNQPRLVAIQIVAVLISWLVAGAGTWLILKGLSYFMDLRVSYQVEEEGLDIHLHGEEAYGEDLAGEITFSKRPLD
jgi:Amt family ammonium transporter